MRGTTVLHATHIFDRMDEWATHVLELEEGRVRRFFDLATLRASTPEPLLGVVESWLREAP